MMCLLECPHRKIGPSILSLNSVLCGRDPSGKTLCTTDMMYLTCDEYPEGFDEEDE